MTSLSFQDLQRYSCNMWEEFKASEFVRKVAGTFTTRIMLQASGLLTSVLIARILGPEGRGAYAVAVAVGAMGVQFTNLGLHSSNTYLVARERALLPALVSNSFYASLILGGIVAACSACMFFLKPHWAPIQGPLLWLSLVWIPLGLYYLLLQNLLLGINEVNVYNKIELVTKLLSIALMAALLVAGTVTPDIIFVVSLMVLMVGVVWAYVALGKQDLQFGCFSFQLFRANIGYSLRGYAAALFAFIALRVDLLIIQYMLGTEHSGHYSVAVALADAVYLLPVTVGTILFPQLSGMTNETEKWKFARKVATVVGFVMMVLALLASLTATAIVKFLYGYAFLPAVPAFIALMPGVVILSVNSLLMNYLASAGMPSIVVYSSLMAAMTNVGLNFALIPELGIVGAALSMTASCLLMLAISLFYILFKKEI
jgi:O-antigen/teichoic acid export membrane protein